MHKFFHQQVLPVATVFKLKINLFVEQSNRWLTCSQGCQMILDFLKEKQSHEAGKKGGMEEWKAFQGGLW